MIVGGTISRIGGRGDCAGRNVPANTLLWDGDPTENIGLILDESKLHLIMKDGVTYKDIM